MSKVTFCIKKPKYPYRFQRVVSQRLAGSKFVSLPHPKILWALLILLYIFLDLHVVLDKGDDSRLCCCC